MDEKYLQELYADLQSRYGNDKIIPYGDFSTKVKSDTAYQRQLYDDLSSAYGKDKVIGYDDFTQKIKQQPAKPLPAAAQQMPDMGIHPVGTYENQPDNHAFPTSKGDIAALPGIPTEQKVKQKETASASIKTAIDNSVNKKVEGIKSKGFAVTKEAEKMYREQFQSMHDAGDLVVSKDGEGKPVLKKDVNPLKGMINAVNDTYIENLHNGILSGLDKQGKIDYLKVKPILDAKYKSDEESTGAAGAIAKIAGENAGVLAEATAGSMGAAAVAPAVVGAGAVGSFIAMAHDLTTSGYAGEMQKTFHALVQQGMPEDQAMEQAHKAGLVGEATSLATGAALSGHIKPSAAKGLLNGITKSLSYEAPKMAAVSGAATFINDLAESGIGVKKKDGEILKNVVESAGHGALMGSAFWILQNPGKVFSYLRPQAENVIASMPAEQRAAFIKTAEQNEVIPKGAGEAIEQKVQEFTKAKEPIDNLPIPEENKAAIAGKILQKQKLQDELTTLTKHGEAFAPRIEELTNQITGIEKEIGSMYKAKDVFSKEQDSLTGEKPEEIKTEKDAVQEQNALPLGESTQNAELDTNKDDIPERAQEKPSINRQAISNDKTQISERRVDATGSWLDAIERGDSKAERNSSEELLRQSNEEEGQMDRELLLANNNTGRAEIRTQSSDGEDARTEIKQVGTRSPQRQKYIEQLGRQLGITDGQPTHSTPSKGEVTGTEEEFRSISKATRRQVVDKSRQVFELPDNNERALRAGDLRKMLHEASTGREKEFISKTLEYFALQKYSAAEIFSGESGETGKAGSEYSGVAEGNPEEPAGARKGQGEPTGQDNEVVSPAEVVPLNGATEDGAGTETGPAEAAKRSQGEDEVASTEKHYETMDRGTNERRERYENWKGSKKVGGDELIKVYRTIGASDNSTEIKAGDWVSASREYVTEYGDKNDKVLEGELPAKYLVDVQTGELPLDTLIYVPPKFSTGESGDAARTTRHYEEIAGSKPTKTGRVAIDPIIGGEPKQISKIIKDVSTSLSQKLFFARPGRRKAIGTYAPGSTAVKIRFNGDLDTTAHEIGHALDDAFGIIADLKTTKNIAVENELRKFSGHGSTPPKGHPDPRMYKLGEGFAEWLRARVVNPAEAIKQAPELNKLYEAKVSDKFKKGIEQFSTDVRTWAGASGRDITLANIEWKPEEAKGLMQKIFAKNEKGDQFHLTYADNLAANFVNPMHAFEKAWQYAKDLRGVGEVLPEEDPTILSRLFLSVDNKFGEFLTNGLRDSRDVLIKDANGKAKNFKWLLEPLNNIDEASLKSDMKDTMVYMVAERTLELANRFDRGDVLTGVGAGMFTDTDVALKTLREIKSDPQKLTRIEAAAERYRSFSDDILQYMVDKGRLSAEQYKAIKDNNVQYVALRRVLETEPDREIEVFKGSGGKLTSVAQPVNTIKGSTKTIANPYISLLDTMNRSIKEADRNDVMKAFTDMLVSDRKMYAGAPEKLAEIGVRGADGDKNTITVFAEGKPEKWILQEDVYKALKGLDGDTYKLPQILTLHAKVLRATVTKFPVFALRNIIRDTPDRIIKSTDGSGFKDFFGDKQHWQDLARNGGLNAGFYVKDKVHYYGMMEQAMKDMTSKGHMVIDGDILKKAWHGYESILQKSETANRVAEYRAALRTAKKKGMDDYNASLYAAFKARDLMDFALMGHYMKVINKVVPFSNAAVQGLRSTYNSAAKNPAAFAARVAIYTILPQVAFWVWNHKDEETARQYEEMADYQKDLFMNFKVGANKWAAIPLPYELGLPAAGINRTLSKVFKYNDKAFDGYAGEVFKTLSPIDESALTNSFTPELELMFNKSLFTGKHIVPEDEEPLDLSLRNTKYASRFGQAIQNAAGIDARKADYWVKAHFSYLGDVVIKASNIGDDQKQAFDATTTGLIKRTPAYNSKSVQDMLDFAAKWDLGKTQEAKYLKSLAHEYFNVKTDEEKEALAKQMIDFSKTTLAAWKPVQEEGGLKSQQKAQARKN